MRLHRLQLNAFGPYAGEEAIDFDAIAQDGGFFLLRGDTGSGKTSLLDAVCFALYGDLPGARTGSKDHLRSDHAGPGEQPWVHLDFSVRSRRFRVCRTPVWYRPKKRGTGTVRANPTATLEEFRDGEWTVLAATNQEVGTTLKPLLGMDKEQFTRVAMLPQGDFAKFLHSTSDERAKLLRRLFDTTIYDRTVELAAERNRTLRERSGEQLARREASIAELRAGLSTRWGEEALAALAEESSVPDAGAPAPAAATGDDGAAPAEGSEAWFEVLAGEAERRAQVAREERDRATRAAEAARAALEEARRQVRDQAELEQWQRRRAALEQGAEQEKQDRAAVRDHERASRVLPHIEEQRRAQVDVSRAAASVVEALPALQEVEASLVAAIDSQAGQESWEAWLRELDAVGTSVPEDPGALVGSAGRWLARAEEEVERAAQDLAVEAEATAAEQNRKSAALQRDRAATLHAEAATALEAALAEVRAAEAGRSPAPDRDEARAVAEHRDAVVVLESARTAQRLAERLSRAKDARDAARSEEREAYDAQTALFSARSEAAAQALAQDLVPGRPCAVCGATEHPAPAPSEGADAVGQEALDAAAARVEAARTAETRAQEALGRAEAEHDRAAAAAKGLGVDTAAQAEQTARELMAELAQAWKDHRHGLERVQAAQQALAAAQRSEQVRSTGLEEADAALQEATRVARESGERAAAGRGGHRDAAARLDAVTVWRNGLSRTARSLNELDQARRREREATARLQQQLAQEELPPEQVRQLVLEPARARALVARLAELDAERSRLEELSGSEPVVRALAARRAGDPVPDEDALTELQADAARAETTRSEAAAGVGTAEATRADVARAGQRVQDLTRDLGPLLDEAATAKAIAEVLAGNGENLRGMSLPTYVLAARLETVAEAASRRLAGMGDGRYRLLHVDAKLGRGHSGLGLAVEDAWTGAVRAPETLSGGETFMVSLALALGLADVVQEESGGVDVETLFVDEGFGTLDQQTLDEVLDGLDRLREGGRMVGIVSHVPELAERVPTQIRVIKTREGSTTKMVTASRPD